MGWHSTCYRIAMNELMQMLPRGNKVKVSRCAWCDPVMRCELKKYIEKTFDVSHGVCDTCLKVWKSNLNTNKTTK